MSVDSPNRSERHLHTGRLKPDLNRHVMRSGATMVGAQAIAAVVALGSTVILARLLRPEDFGLTAMVLPVAVLGTVLRNFGLDVAIIQREELGQAQVNALFWLSFNLNLLLGGLLAAMAPLLAWFYAEPRVLEITLALVLGVLALGSGGVHEALLKRQMRFGVLSALALVSAITGAITALGLALAGAGYWALAAQMVVANVVQGLGCWWCCDWRPASRGPAASSHDAVSRSMISYGRHLTATRLLTIGSQYFDRVVIGWMSGPAMLGLYENGRRLPFFVLDKLYDACFGVAVAGFSRAGNDAKRYRAFGTKALQFVLAILLPALAFLMSEAETVTLLFLGDQWLAAVPYARLLAAAAFGQALTRTLQWFYLSSGDTLRQFRWIVVQTVVTGVAVGVGAWFGGSYGVAFGVAVAACVLSIPAIGYGLRRSVFTAADFGRAAARPMLLSLGTGGAVWGLAENAFTLLPPWQRFFMTLPLFTVIYAASWIALPAGRATATELLGLLLRTWRERGLRSAQSPPAPPA